MLTILVWLLCMLKSYINTKGSVSAKLFTITPDMSFSLTKNIHKYYVIYANAIGFKNVINSKEFEGLHMAYFASNFIGCQRLQLK